MILCCHRPPILEMDLDRLFGHHCLDRTKVLVMSGGTSMPDFGSTTSVADSVVESG